MNRFSKCKNNRKGFTLIEILATLIILVLLVVAIGSIMTSAMKVYDESIFESDAAVLSNILDSSLGDLLRYARSVTTGASTKAPYIVDGSSSPVLILGENVYSLEDKGFYFTNLDYGVQNGYLSLTEDGYVALNSPIWDESKANQLLVNEGSYAGEILVKSLQVKYYPIGVEVETEAEDITPDDGSGDGGYFVVDYVIAAGPEEGAPQIERSVCVRLMNAEVSSTASSGERVPVDRGSHEDYSGASEHVVNYHAHKEGDDWDGAKMVVRAGEYSDMVSDNVSGRVVTLFGQDSAVLDGMVLRAWVDKSGNEYKPGASYDFTNKIINLYGSWEKEPQQLTVNLKNGAELTLTYQDADGASVTTTLTSSERLEIPQDNVVYYSFNNYDVDAHSGCEPKVTLIKRGHAETSLSKIAVSGDFIMGEGSYTLNAAVPYLVTWSLDGTDATWVDNGGKTLVTPFYDQAVAIPAINYQGHDVASWTASPETLLAPARGDRSYYASGDVTLTPTFEVNTVRFNGDPRDADAGHDAELASFTYDELTYYYTPSIEGWTFLGWYNAGGKLYSDLASIKTALESGSLDLYAHYVKFDASSALSATAAGVTLRDKSVDLVYPNVTVASNAYFLGWYTEDNTFIGYDRPYNDDPTFWSWRVILSARTVTLEKVTDSEGEVIHYSEGKVNQNSGTLCLPGADYTATDAKYYFLGWYDLKDYGNFWGAAGKSITTGKNLTLYPRWLKITTSAVDTRGDLLDFTSAEVTLSADGSFVISVSPVIYDGYTFKGWYRVEGENRTLMGTAVNSPLTARSSVTVYDAALVEDTAYFTYASMDRNAGLLGYYVGDEEMADPRITVAIGAVSGEAPLITAKPLTNYKFDRWERIQNGELVDTYKTENLQITRQDGEVFKDTTFNAYFVLNSCPLTIHADHATIVEQGTENSWPNEAPVEVGVGTSLTTSVDFGGISLSDGSGYLIKPDFGYTLAGWQVEYDHYVLGASGLEVTAVVKPITYNVTYVGLDPMESEAETAGIYTYGTDVQLQIPENPDWEFEGWVVQKAQSVKGVDWDDEHDRLWENVGTEENPLTAAPKDSDGYTYGNVKLKAKWSAKMVDLQVDLSETWVLINLQESSVTVTYPDSTTKNFKVSDASFILSGISSGASAEYSSDLKTVTITANNGVWKIAAHPGRYSLGVERSVNVDFAQALSGGAIRGENPIVKIDFNRGFDEEIPAITFDAGDGGSISGYDPNNRSFSGKKTIEFDHGTELTVYKDRITYQVRNYSSTTTRTITAKPSNHYQNDGWSIVDAGGVVTKITADKYIVNQSVTIRADFIGVDCPVTVKAGLGGTVNEEKQISFTAHYGDAVLADSDSLAIGSETVLAKADRGYHFSGWGNLPETVTGSLEITAGFAGNTAVFDANGGAFADSSLQQQLTYAGSPLTPEQPARPGFLFVNWYKDASGQISAGDMVPETDGAIYYAKWDQQTYLVTLEKEGPGNLDHNEIRIPSNSRVTQSTNNLNLIYFTNSSTGLNSEQVSAFVTEDGYRFDHWVFDANGASEVMEPGVAKTIEKSPTAIKAVFTGYQITLDAKGGHFESDDVTRKTLLYSAYNWEHLPEPTRSGYRFAGWLTEDGNEPSVPSSDITLVAAWETLKYFVTIDAVTNGIPDETGKGGTAQTEDEKVWLQAYSENAMAVDQTAGTVTISVKAPAGAEAKDVLIEAEAKDGYHFVSWAVSNNEGSTTQVLNNMTLTANFAGNKVIYDAGEGVFEDGNHTFEEVYDGVLTEPVPSLGGSTFLGWFVDATTPVSQDPVPHSETTTYTAHWDVASYSLSISTQGSGSVGDYPSSLSYESEITASDAVLTVTDKATVATKTVTAAPGDGFYFNGWTLNNESWDGEKHTVREDVSIVASFEGYEVTFDAGDGKFADQTSEKTKTFGESSFWETPVRGGYRFNGWYLTDQKVESETYVPKGNETLVADWTGYTVTYDPNGGMINGSAETTSEVFSGALHLPTPTMLGHKFEGWFTAAEDGNVVRPSTIPTDNVTYYAHWSDESYTISYYSNGSPVTPQGATTAYHYGDTVVLTKLESYGEFTFLGWKIADSTENNWSTELITDASVSDVYGNVRLDAQWLEKEYTVTYTGVGFEGFSEIYKSSMSDFTIADAPETGDYFLEWIVENSDNRAFWPIGESYQPGDLLSVGTKGNVTLRANWTSPTKKITVTVGNNGHVTMDGVRQSSSFTFDVPTGSTWASVSSDEVDFITKNGTIKLVATENTRYVYSPQWSLGALTEKEILEDKSISVSFRFLGSDAYVVTIVSNDSSMGNVSMSTVNCNRPGMFDWTRNYDTYTVNANVLTVNSSLDGTIAITATPAKAGYRFTGWTLNNAVLQNGDVRSNITITANFAANKAIFDSNGGFFADGSTENKEITYAGEAIVPPVVTRGGDTFEGWYSGETSVSGAVTPTAESVTYTAKWTPKDYELIYQDEERNDLGNKETYRFIDTLTLRSYDKNFYTLDSWIVSAMDASGYNWSASYKPGVTVGPGLYGNVFLIENWKADTYTLAYELNGGTASGTYTPAGDYSVETSVQLPYVSRDGCSFTGWTVAVQGEGNWETSYDGRTLNLGNGFYGDVTLTANWIPVTYTVTYYGNGAEDGSTEASAHTYDVEKALTANGFYKTGYAFQGWATGPAADVAYADKQVVKNLSKVQDANVTLFAKWALANYTITYNFNDGEPVGNYTAGTYTINDAFVLPKVTKVGNTFKGWTVSVEDGGKWVESYNGNLLNLGTGYYGDVTLTAEWEPIKYNIEFSAEGGSGSMSGIYDVKYGDEVTLPANAFERKGYAFAGWTTDNGGLYDDGAKVSNLSAIPTTVVLRAKWVDALYTITYEGAEGSPASYRYGQEFNLSIPSASSKPGYTFKRWTVKETNGNWRGEFTQASPKVNVGMYGDVTLLAEWNPISYKISYENNGGTITGDYTVGSYTIETPVTLPSISRTGYAFQGWKVKVSDGGKWAESYDGSSLSLGAGFYGDVTLSAEWLGYSYTVNYNKNGGNGTMQPSTFTYGDSGSLSNCEFSRGNGYDFLGWNTAADGSGTFYPQNASYSLITANMPEGGTVTLYAQWARNSSVKASVNTNGSNDSQGGSVTPTSATVHYGDSIESAVISGDKKSATLTIGSETFTATANPGYYIDGFTSDKTGTVNNTSISLTAKIYGYTITFDGNGGEIGNRWDHSGTVEKSYSSSLRLLGNGDFYSMPDGVELEGWYTARDGGDKVSSVPAPEDDVTYYAHWKASSGGGGCVATGTQITLANGKQVPVEKLKGDEMLLVWNLDTGRYDAAPIVFVDSDPTAEYEIIHLYFEDGTDVKVITEHGFFDLDLGEYVYLDENAADYIGHRFVKRDGRKWTTVKLTDVVIETEVTESYSPVTYGHLCYYVNGMLSMPGGISGLFNIYDVDVNTMAYDAVKKAEDIKASGQFTFEDFAGMISEEAFGAFNGADLKVAMDKGILTWEDVAYMAERYMPLVEEN